MHIVKKQNSDLIITVPKEWDGLTIEDVLKKEWHLSKKTIHLIRMDKLVAINGKNVRFSERLQKGQKFIIHNVLQYEDYGYEPYPVDFNVLYEDDFLLVVNKPAGIATHPNKQEDIQTLANGIAYYLQEKGERCKVHHVHRLDKDTSGAILFTKSSFVGAILDHQLTERKIKRTYTAIVHGKLKKKRDIIRAKIGRDRHHPTRRRVSPTGQDAITHYEVIAFDAKKNVSQIRCELKTGRTHQIRVHLAHIGHPLVGDTLYGGKPIFYRQALHGQFLTFIHPFTLEKIKIEAPFIDNFPTLC
ncbi:RluA family pseudouridine synthase [Pallidibacillus thermolactis]|uniref:RluA family pseudouridine synthase n=1 Tax=Pallidibacillus thermolactis TaxID=251051 RepID=UPI0021DA322C|nr:RluA family pseudouridine synthase [Pallidibacillus thermolactis]MCU9602136.1 RluA family pseudouridine synthase [Pallidibacillus thermolactis subsp. kokeshiiformis]